MNMNLRPEDVNTLSEQNRSPKQRSYRQTKRADGVQATRARIVEAAVELHGTVGPAATSVAAVAERAGVTRLTVYRHFPDTGALFAACSAHWSANQRLPDVASWEEVRDPRARLQAGLRDLYRFYADAAPMLTRVLRDSDAIPRPVVEARLHRERIYRTVLLKPFTSRGARRRRLAAALGHATIFSTWQSLDDQGLSPRQAADLMAEMVSTLAA